MFASYLRCGHRCGWARTPTKAVAPLITEGRYFGSLKIGNQSIGQKLALCRNWYVSDGLLSGRRKSADTAPASHPPDES